MAPSSARPSVKPQGNQMYRSSFTLPKLTGKELYRPGRTATLSVAPHLGQRPVFFISPAPPVFLYDGYLPR